MEKNKVSVAFGKVLRKIRRDQDLSQEALAAQAGLTSTYISFLERGMRSPTLDTMVSLCDALGISLINLASLIEQRIKHNL